MEISTSWRCWLVVFSSILIQGPQVISGQERNSLPLKFCQPMFRLWHYGIQRQCSTLVVLFLRDKSNVACLTKRMQQALDPATQPGCRQNMRQSQVFLMRDVRPHDEQFARVTATIARVQAQLGLASMVSSTRRQNSKLPRS